MSVRLGVVMDPIGSIIYKKDSTFAMLAAAQDRGWSIAYMEMNDLFMRDGVPAARIRELEVIRDPSQWYRFGAEAEQALADLDVILMRKDPPFNIEYIYATYLLERAEASGSLIVNRPQALRDANEKLFTAWFSQCTPPTLVSRRFQQLRAFVYEFEDVILKPLEGMGGASVFRVSVSDPNLNVVMETLTAHESRYIMAQRYIPQISEGDKRILVIDGEPVPYALARIPMPGETRGNLAAGGQGVGRELSERDLWICQQVGPTLREKGIMFAGLDVIGDYLTEINVTSPTCIRELDDIYGLDIGAQLMDAIAVKLTAAPAMATGLDQRA